VVSPAINNLPFVGLNPDTNYTVVIYANKIVDDTIIETITTDTVTLKTTGGVGCFAEGTRILTQSGYKAIETLTADDRIVTADNRVVAFKRMKTTLRTTTKRTAPYLIRPHAFGSYPFITTS
jgi:hypothetical protein